MANVEFTRALCFMIEEVYKKSAEIHRLQDVVQNMEAQIEHLKKHIRDIESCHNLQEQTIQTQRNIIARYEHDHSQRSSTSPSPQAIKLGMDSFHYPASPLETQNQELVEEAV